MPSRRLVCFSNNDNILASILVKIRYGSLGILGHSLRNKIPIVGKQGESEGYVEKNNSVKEGMMRGAQAANLHYSRIFRIRE